MPSREAYEGFPESVGLNLEMSNSNSLIPIFAFLHNVLIFFFFFYRITKSAHCSIARNTQIF